MGLWGSVAGVATLVGPILGGVLVDHAGWEWIFFVNVPVGLIGLAMAWKLVPSLPSHAHKFDLVGVALSAVALFCVVFGIQEGAQYDWGTITGIISVPLLIILGLVFFVLFILWERRYRGEQLVPLHLFANRNFSLANIAITSVGFAITAMSFPIMIYAQAVLGYSPTKAALLLAPMAVISGLLAPVVGGLVDRKHPAILAGFGLVCFSVALFWYGRMLGADTSIWWLLAIACLLGVANGFMWAPLSVTATRTLEPRFAGAGSGIYNTTRQIGAVIGSAYGGVKGAQAGSRAAEAAVRKVFTDGLQQAYDDLASGAGKTADQVVGAASEYSSSAYGWFWRRWSGSQPAASSARELAGTAVSSASKCASTALEASTDTAVSLWGGWSTSAAASSVSGLASSALKFSTDAASTAWSWSSSAPSSASGWWPSSTANSSSWWTSSSSSSSAAKWSEFSKDAASTAWGWSSSAASSASAWTSSKAAATASGNAWRGWSSSAASFASGWVTSSSASDYFWKK